MKPRRPFPTSRLRPASLSQLKVRLMFPGAILLWLFMWIALVAILSMLIGIGADRLKQHGGLKVQFEEIWNGAP